MPREVDRQRDSGGRSQRWLMCAATWPGDAPPAAVLPVACPTSTSCSRAAPASPQASVVSARPSWTPLSGQDREPHPHDVRRELPGDVRLRDGARRRERRVRLRRELRPNPVRPLASCCGGYSQGAAVVDMLMGIPPLGDRIGNLGAPCPPASAPTWRPSRRSAIPRRNSATRLHRRCTCSRAGRSTCARTATRSVLDGRNPFAHSDYVSAGLANQAANFVAGLV